MTAAGDSAAPLGWLGIIRLGLVQAALGAVIVLTTSTINRVMVVELALPAILPGALVAFHYLVQILRPRLGHGSDQGGRRTPWIVGGMAVLSLGGVGAASATALVPISFAAGMALAIASFALVGAGVGAAGTSLLVLLAKRVEPRRRAAAASIVWIMMIVGFVITAGISGHLLEPFSLHRLIFVAAGVAAAAFLLATAAIAGIEGTAAVAAEPPAPKAGQEGFWTALRDVWDDPQARTFSIFVFLSMLAYSAQELVLEPFAGAVFHLTPGASTKLTGLQNGGALAGMLLVAVVGSVTASAGRGRMRLWTIGGCAASAASLLGLAFAGFVGPAWPLSGSVFALGMANGAFAVSAIGAMMELAGARGEARAGVRMGLWGAAQAVAFAVGGLAATAASDVARYFFGTPVSAYAAVFVCEAILFLIAARQAAHVFPAVATRRRRVDDGFLAATAKG